METAKLFWSGRSQAVRLPKAFRIEGEEVRIRRHGAAVVLEPIPADWNWLDALSGPLDVDFQEASNEETQEQPRPEKDQDSRDSEKSYNLSSIRPTETLTSEASASRSQREF